MWRTKANQWALETGYVLLYCCAWTLQHVMSFRGIMAWSCLESMLRVLTPPSPSCFLPSPFGTAKVLSLAGPTKTTLLSSRLAHGPRAREQYRVCVSAALQPQSCPGNRWGSQQLPTSSCPRSLPQPLFLEVWRQGCLHSCQNLMTDDLYDQHAGYSDVKYLFALFPHVPLPHTPQYNQAVQSLSLCFSFSGFIEKNQCLKNSCYYLMIFWKLRLISFVMLSED